MGGFGSMSPDEKFAFVQNQKREKRRAWINISIVGLIIVVLTGIFTVWIGTI